MSKATKRKHVVKEVMEDYVTPTDDQQIMRVLGSNGNNLHKAVTDSGEQFLLSMPTKFRKNIWIKRGDFVIVDPIKEGGKVKGEISSILYRNNIQYLRKLGVWPKGFLESTERNEGTRKGQNEEKKDQEEAECDSDSENDDSDLFVNTNRATVLYSESEEETDDDDEDEEEDCDGREQTAKILPLILVDASTTE